MASLLRAKRTLWGFIFGLVTVMGWLSYVSGRRYMRAEAWVEHTLQVQGTLNVLVGAVQQAEADERGFLLTADETQLQACRASEAMVAPELRKLQELVRDNPNQQARATRLSRLIDEKLSFVEASLQPSRSGERAAAIARDGHGIQTMTAIRALGAEMASVEQGLLEARKGGAEHAQTQAVWGIGVGSALTIALSLLSLISVHRDVDALRRTAEELATSEEYFRLLAENSSDLIRTHDLTAKLLYVSPSVERMLGYTQEEFMTFPPLTLVHPDDRAMLAPDPDWPISERHKYEPVEYRILHKDGSYRWLEISFASRRDADGNVTGIQSSARDVTDRRLAEQRLTTHAEQLRNLSLHDELTGLYNRRGWLELARQGLRLAMREKRPAAVIYADLNGMKEINDVHGHEEGDQALKDTARILRAACREADVVARFGGDEFVVFALGFENTGLEALRSRAQGAIAELNLSGVRPFRLSLSIGAAFFRPDKAETIEELLDRADTEMYERKRARRDNGGMSLPPPVAH
ncbi:MAG TPA: diguanylate cyclase [Polyangiaceae bacterium]|jgi:diguanylate cyclase (GGDEF)-like protein/PAS domain S-box-containing protein|nr:diguanylate cyclase [Polyangiaceae bacterium]